MGLNEFRFLKENLLAVARIESKEISVMENKLSVIEKEIPIQDASRVRLNRDIESIKNKSKKALSSSEIARKEKEISDIKSELEKVKEKYYRKEKWLYFKRASYFPMFLLLFGSVGLLASVLFSLESDEPMPYFAIPASALGYEMICGFFAFVFFIPIKEKYREEGILDIKNEDYNNLKTEHIQKMRKRRKEIKEGKKDYNKMLEKEKRKHAKVEVAIKELKKEQVELLNQIIEAKNTQDKLVAEVAHLIPFSSEIL